MLEYKGINITWLGHSSFKISNSKVIYIDPYQIKPGVPADIILITHEHFDHCSMEDVKKLLKSNTVVITTPQAQDKLRNVSADFLMVTPGKSYSVDGVKIVAVPAYNVNKFRSPGIPYHPKQDNKVGFVFEMNGVKFYHAGDTDFIPEMESELSGIDVAMLPVSGTYVMTPEEAAEAAESISPNLVIPMHFGTIAGTERDAYKLQRMTNIEVAILENES